LRSRKAQAARGSSFPTPTDVVLLVLAAAGLLRAGVGLLHAAPTRDVAIFYESAQAWWRGASLYAGLPRPNLNPPLFVLAWTPLARLPFLAAVWIWTVLGVLSLAGSVRVMQRALGWTPRTVIRLLLGLTATLPAQIAWGQGQVTWVLLYPVTKAWLAARIGRPVTAGAWLAPAIAVKPLLALLPLPLGVGTLAAAALGSAGLTLGGVAITGVGAWRDWLSNAPDVTWIGVPDNVSLWGTLARGMGVPFEGVLRVSDFPAWAVLTVLTGAGLLAYRAAREPDMDRRWTLAGLFTIAASPLGWLYYLPVFLGPLAAVATRPCAPAGWLRAGGILLLIPMQVLGALVHRPVLYAIGSSVYSAALLCLVLGAIRSSAPASPPLAPCAETSRWS
jgi:hypothetical protein